MIIFSVFTVFITACSASLASLNHLPPDAVLHHASHLVEGWHGEKFSGSCGTQNGLSVLNEDFLGTRLTLDTTILYTGTEDFTSVDLDRFELYAQYAGASYCDHVKAGSELFCKGDICPGRGQNATYYASLE